MKESPLLRQVEARMQPGALSRDGFLGDDPRSLAEILDDDDNAVRRLGLTHRTIAERMNCLATAGREGLGTTVEVEGRYEITVETVRGMLPCPWGHRGLVPKENVSLRDARTGYEITWTALTAHMIAEHGFYEGRGSPFRVEPAHAKRTLGL